MNFYSVCFADMPMKTIEFLSKECVDGLERRLYLLLDLAWYTRRFIAQATPLCVLGVAVYIIIYVSVLHYYSKRRLLLFFFFCMYLPAIARYSSLL